MTHTHLLRKQEDNTADTNKQLNILQLNVGQTIVAFVAKATRDNSPLCVSLC